MALAHKVELELMQWMLQINSIPILVIYFLHYFSVGTFSRKSSYYQFYVSSYATVQNVENICTIFWEGNRRHMVNWLCFQNLDHVYCMDNLIFLYILIEKIIISHLDFQRWASKLILKLRKSQIFGLIPQIS